jgi:GNAT superfamily N-acetyltransferase
MSVGRTHAECEPKTMTRLSTQDEATDPYQGSVAPLAQKYGLAWALDPDGAYLGGTDRETDHHFLSWDRGQIVGVLKFRLRPGELHLAHILVAPTHRLRGRASQLFDRFLAWAAKQSELEGFTVTCEITAADRERVEGMLVKRGFSPDGAEWRRPV